MFRPHLLWGDLTGQFDDPHERIVLCLDLTVDLSRRGRSGVSR